MLNHGINTYKEDTSIVAVQIATVGIPFFIGAWPCHTGKGYTGKPQYVTNHSHPDLVITAKSRNEKREGEEKEENKRFIEFLMSCPRVDIFPD